MGLGGMAAKLMLGGVATVVAGSFLKAKTTDPIEDDPEKPRASDGAPAVNATKTNLDAINPKYSCETKGWGCDNTDVLAHLHTLNRVMGELQAAASNLQQVAPADDPEANRLLGLAQQFGNNFQNTYGGVNWQSYSVQSGAELAAIGQINLASTDSVRLKTEILNHWSKLAPSGSVPQGNIGSGWQPPADDGSDVAPYAAAGAVAGLGLAMVAVIALQQNKSKNRV